MRILLRKFDEKQDWKAFRDELERLEGTSFDDIDEPAFLKDMGVRGAASEQKKLPTVLKLDWNADSLLDKLYNNHINLHNLHPVWRSKIDFGKL